MPPPTTAPVVRRDEKEVEFLPVGCSDKIKLSVKIVQNLIAVPTRSGKTCTERDAFKFIMLCAARKLNPFEGDAFLIGYDGTNGPEFSLITAHQALMKRAEIHPEFDGMQSGVIVQAGEFTNDLEGDFHTEDQKLVGGWAKVFFKTRKYPSTERLPLENFIKTKTNGEPTKFWAENPEGQIVKCAEASALRKAFPTMIGGLYLREEIGNVSEAIGVLPTPDFTPASTTPETTRRAVSGGNDDGGLGPEKPAADSPRAKLLDLVRDEKLTFDAYQKWAESSANDKDAGSRSTWEEIPEELCVRYLRANVGFIRGVRAFQSGGAA